LAGREAQAQTYVFGNASYSAPGLNSTSAITNADFNGDGIPDVVILGSTSGGLVLSIFLGRPDGSFAPRVDYSVQATGFTVGDFNGDGKLDVIVVTYGYTITGSILLGNGDGTLQPPVPLNQNIGNGYSAAASGDFNGDGKLDLLLLTPNFGSGATMAILLGNGDGSFQTSVTYPVPVSPYIVVRDFNGDGKPDIAISGGISGSGEVSILINNGGGTFKSPANYSISGNVQALAAADLNADGKLDLVVSSGGTSATISVLLGNGDGTFGSPIVYTSNLLSIYSASIAVADFNGDGKLDVALTNSEGPTNAVAIILGNGDGTLQSPPLLYSSGLLPAAVVSLDVNGDGKPDLAVAGGYGVTSYFSLTTLINRGDGTFPNPVNFPVLQFPYSAVTGDFNGDGNVDIATTSLTQTGGVSVLLGKGDGTFQPHLDSPTAQAPTAIVAGDFNGDGKLDLVVADSTPTSQLLSTLIGNGDGTFQNNIPRPRPVWSSPLPSAISMVMENSMLPPSSGVPVPCRFSLDMATVASPLRSSIPPVQCSFLLRTTTCWSAISMVTASWIWRPRLTMGSPFFSVTATARSSHSAWCHLCCLMIRETSWWPSRTLMATASWTLSKLRRPASSMSP
jgi:hypothetical protein